jgi:hypothetical protein
MDEYIDVWVYGCRDFNGETYIDSIVYIVSILLSIKITLLPLLQTILYR